MRFSDLERTDAWSSNSRVRHDCVATDPGRAFLSSFPDGYTRHLDNCCRCQAVVEGLTGGNRTWLDIAAELRQPRCFYHRLACVPWRWSSSTLRRCLSNQPPLFPTRMFLVGPVTTPN